MSEDPGAGCLLEDSACLGVQLHLLFSVRVLDAGNVGLEGFPYRPHLGVERWRWSPSKSRELRDELGGHLHTCLRVRRLQTVFYNCLYK